MLKDEMVRAITQLVVITLIPVLCWLIRTRGRTSFFAWIGLKKPEVSNRVAFYALGAVGVLVAITMSLVLDPLLPNDIQLANARYTGQRAGAILPAIIFSLFATALPEEILFRGFLGMHAFKKLGFFWGNMAQAVIFGLLHGATMLGNQPTFVALLVIAFTGSLGLVMGDLNRQANHSIVPSVVLHALANLYATMLIAFGVGLG